MLPSQSTISQEVSERYEPPPITTAVPESHAKLPSQSNPSSAAGSPQPQPKSYKHDPSSSVAPKSASKLHAVASVQPSTPQSPTTPLAFPPLAKTLPSASEIDQEFS